MTINSSWWKQCHGLRGFQLRQHALGMLHEHDVHVGLPLQLDSHVGGQFAPHAQHDMPVAANMTHLICSNAQHVMMCKITASLADIMSLYVADPQEIDKHGETQCMYALSRFVIGQCSCSRQEEHVTSLAIFKFSVQHNDSSHCWL